MCVSDSDRRPTVIVYRVFSHNQTWPEPNERFCLSVNAFEYGGGGGGLVGKHLGARDSHHFTIPPPMSDLPLFPFPWGEWGGGGH